MCAVVGAGLLGCGDDGTNKLPDASPTDSGTDAPPAAPGMLRLVPTTADFGSVVVGQTSAQVAITVGNIGMGPTGNISAAIAGGASSNFTVASTDCNILQPAQTCVVNLTFTPASPGAKSAMLSVTASPGGTVMASLDGTGIAPGALMISPSTHGFGNVLVGQTSAIQTFTVTNSGGTTSGTLTTTAGGATPGEFTKVTDTCQGMTLAGAATCQITVQFAPQSAGVKFGNFSIAGMPGGTVVTAVNGVALAPAQLVINPPSQNFGSVVVGANSSDITVNVVNIGGVASGTLSQSLTGAGSGEFAVVSSTCVGATLAPGGSCQILARFAPTSTGMKSATLGLSATPGGQVSSALSGTGILAGALRITPSSTNYNNTTVGTPTPAVTYTVTNDGGTTTGTLGTGLGGADAGQFVLSANTCEGVTLAPMATCTMAVAFAPTTVGIKSAVLFASSSPGGTVQAGLGGNALPQAALAITPLTKDYGSVGVGLQTQPTVFTVQNVGGTNSGVPAIALGGTNPTQFSFTTDCTIALVPLATCQVSVRFNPMAVGNFAASVSATGAPGGMVSSNLFGQGVDPAALSVNPSSLPFPGITLIGDTTAPLVFTVTNNGGTTTGTLTLMKTGAHPGDFNIANNTCSTLAPGGTCTVSVTFQPQVRGARTASIQVSGNPGGSVSVALSGDALPRLEIIDVDEGPPVATIDFGTVTAGAPWNVGRWSYVTVRNNTDMDQLLTLTEGYGTPGQWLTWYLSCGDQKDLVAGSIPQAIIGAHETCTALLIFLPTSEGAKAGTAVFDIGPGILNQAGIGLMGTGRNGLYLEAVTTTNFGNVGLAVTSPVLKFRAKVFFDSPGTGPLTTLAVQDANFAVTADTCTGFSFTGPFSGQSCEIWVTFTPSVLGPDATTLAVTAAPGGSPTLGLRGTGVSPSALQFNPSPLNFGDVFAGTTVVQTLTVTNPAGQQTSGALNFYLQDDTCGGQPLGNFGSGSGSGMFGDCFVLLPPSGGDCVDGATTLAGGASCTVRVQYYSQGGGGFPTVAAVGPGGFGPRSANIVFNAMPGTSGDVYIPTFANSLSRISITPTSRDFGAVAWPATVSQTFTVLNESPGSVLIGTAGFAFSNPDMTITANNCYLTTLLSNATCTITVRFAPSVNQNQVALLEVATDDYNGYATAVVFGDGDAPDLEFTPSFGAGAPANFTPNGPILEGQTASLSFTLVNYGNVAGPVMSVFSGGANATAYTIPAGTDGCTGQAVAPGGNCSFTAVFTGPTFCSGLYPATLDAMAGDPVGLIHVTADCLSIK